MYKYVALGLVLLLAACGGSGSTPPPSSITLTVEDPAGSFNAAAYQVGTGSWQSLTMTGTTTKTATIQMNNETKYGVAVRCGSNVQVIQATSTELANPKVVCSSPTPSTVSFTVNVNISGISVNDNDVVCVNNNNDSCSPPLSAGATSATVNASLEPGTRDLLVTLKDSSGLVKVAKVERNVSVPTTDGGSTSINLTASDVLTPVSFTVPPAPLGYTYGIFPFPLPPFAMVSYLSANGTATGSVNDSLTSYRPVSGFRRGDLYGALAMVYSTNDSGINALLTTLQLFNSGAPSLSFPTPWGSQALNIQQNAHPTISSGLPHPDHLHTDFKGYVIRLQISGFDHTTTLSKGWLGSATSSYTVPDLTGQLGYTAPSGSGTFQVNAVLSSDDVLWFDPNDPVAVLNNLAAGDHIKIATATTNTYTVGGGSLRLP